MLEFGIHRDSIFGPHSNYLIGDSFGPSFVVFKRHIESTIALQIVIGNKMRSQI
jgi:hypothetical protein